MVDVVDAATRSRMMSGIRGKNTAPELQIRRALHALGFRYRLHAKDLPGKPDLVFPKFNAVIFIHGCFWHCHDCHLFKWPSSRIEFWQEKLYGNQQRDELACEQLRQAGWRVLTIWECALKGRTRRDLAQVAERIAKWLNSNQRRLDLRGLSSRQDRRPRPSQG